MMDVTVTTNDREGWCRAWAYLKSRPSNVAYNIPEITFKVKADELNDITNLRYLFPLYDHLMSINKPIRLIVDLQDRENIDADYMRIKRFFSASSVSGIEKRGRVVSVSFGDNTEFNGDFYDSDIFPILKFGGDNDKSEETLNIITNAVLSEVYNKSYLPGAVLSSMGLRLKESDLKIKYIDKYKGIFDFLGEMSKSLKGEKTSFFKNVASIQELANKQASVKIIDSLLDIYGQAKYRVNNKISKAELTAFGNLTGSEDVNGYKSICKNVANFAAENLKELMGGYYLVQSNNENVTETDKLNVFIVLYLVNKFITKDIKGKEDKRRCDRLIMEARSYAEGIWQAVENAQLHSNGHKAFFGMRVYKADMTGGLADKEKSVKNRILLENKYKSIKKAFFENEEASNYFEFYILDNAINEEGNAEGILNKIEQGGKYKKNPEAIEAIFSLTEESAEDAEDFYTVHYGMRWLKRHIDRLSGALEICSPYKSDSSPVPKEKVYFNSLYDSENKKGSENEGVPTDLFSTEYSGIIPLNKTGNALKNDDESSKVIRVRLQPYDKKINFNEIKIDNEYVSDVKKHYVEECNNYGREPSWVGLKETAAKKIASLLTDKGNCIHIHSDFSDIRYVELLGKGVFRYIIRKRLESDEPMRIAVIFDEDKHDNTYNYTNTKNHSFIEEFIRIFTIFYIKQGNGVKSPYMENVQIALCSKNKVHFIIAGDDLRSAYLTAVNFVYYDAEASLEYIPVLRFISETSGDIDAIELFPFDLYLPC